MMDERGWPAGGGGPRTFYRRPLPSPPAIPFASSEGKVCIFPMRLALFREAMEQGCMEGYFRLAEQFVTQVEPAFCGLSSLTMVLNALEIDPRRNWKGAWRWFDERMLDCCESNAKVEKEGIEFHKLAAIAACNGAAVLAHRAQPAILPPDYEPPNRQDIPSLANCHDVAEFRQDVLAACQGDGSHVICAYSRKQFGQTGDGHFSPIGGYHPGRDLVLVLDVARFKYPPHWVALEAMWEAMKHVDRTSGLSRGYLHLKNAPTGRGQLLTLSTQRNLWQFHLQFFAADGLGAVLKQVHDEGGEGGEGGGEGEQRGLDKTDRELDAIVAARPSPSVAVFSLHPPPPPGTAQAVAAADDPRKQVVDAVRQLGLTRAVQRALDRAGGAHLSYVDALSLCGEEGRAEGLWAKEEEEALLLTILLLISPESQWAMASPELRALRDVTEALPSRAREEVTSLQTQLSALIRFGCMCGVEGEHECQDGSSFRGCTSKLSAHCAGHMPLPAGAASPNTTSKVTLTARD